MQATARGVSLTSLIVRESLEMTDAGLPAAGAGGQHEVFPRSARRPSVRSVKLHGCAQPFCCLGKVLWGSSSALIRMAGGNLGKPGLAKAFGGIQNHLAERC